MCAKIVIEFEVVSSAFEKLLSFITKFQFGHPYEVVIFKDSTGPLTILAMR